MVASATRPLFFLMLHLHRHLSMMLNKNQEQALFKRISKGDTNAKALLLAENNLLVKTIAEHYRDNEKGLSVPELIRVGRTGLEKAFKQYDPAKRYKFSTYAAWWIRQAIHLALGIKDVES